MIIATPVLLLQLIVAFIFFDRHWDTMSTKLAAALAGEINMLTTQLSIDGTDAQQAEIVDFAKRDLGLTIYWQEVQDPQKPLQDFEKFYWFGAGTKLKKELEKRIKYPFDVKGNEKEGKFEVVVFLSDKKTLHFLCNESRLVNATTYIFILWLIGSAVILFTVAIIFMRNQIRPIMRLAIAAEKFGKGQDVPDFKPVGASEVRQAAKAFLEMKERLKRQIEQRTAMLSGVSHDLRTPLTRMKLQLAMLKNAPDADNLRADVDEMEKMLEGYLTFARGEGDEVAEMTDLSAILDRIVSNVRRQGHEIETSIKNSLTMKVRPLAIERAISNVVLNACKYAKNVWVSAVAGEDAVEICVDDNGPGIPGDLREDVFRPFYRVEKSRNKKTGGVGLGLSITQDIVHSHGGEIALSDSPKGGLRAVIRLPL